MVSVIECRKIESMNIRGLGVIPPAHDERCAWLIECLPSLQHDPNRPEDVLKVAAGKDGSGGDDVADCLKDLVTAKERKVTQRKPRGP